MGETRSACRILVGKPLRRPRRRWKDNRKVDLGKVGCEDGRWMVAQWWDLVLANLNLRVLLPESQAFFMMRRDYKEQE